jgi:predicted porin
MASQSRTRQVVRWDSPNWNGFETIIAWSANPICNGSGGVCTAGDVGSVTPGNTLATAAGSNGVPGVGPNSGSVITRKGDGWNINPKYTAANWGVEYSYWNAKGDVNNQTGATFFTTSTQVAANSTGYVNQDNQRGDVIAGYFTTSGFRFGLAWNRSKTTAVASGLVTGDRTSWAIPVSYTTGPHTFAMAYTKANDSKDITATTGTANTTAAAGARGFEYTVSGSGTGASLFTLGYQYDLSKRTALGLSYGRLANKNAGNYSFFYNSQTAFGSANAGAAPGETHSLAAATIRHNF